MLPQLFEKGVLCSTYRLWAPILLINHCNVIVPRTDRRRYPRDPTSIQPLNFQWQLLHLLLFQHGLWLGRRVC